MIEPQYNRRAVFAVACLGMLVFGVVVTTLGSILPSIIGRFGLQKAQAGSLLLLMNLGVMGGSLIFGPIVDRHGFKSMLVASLVMTVIGIEGVAFADTFGLLRASVFLVGFAGGVINGGTNALVADISIEGRGAGLSLLGIFFGLGGFGVPFTMSFLIERFSYTEIICGVGAAVFFTGVIFIAVRFPAPKQPQGFPLRQGFEILRNPALLLLAAMLLLQSGVEMTASGWSAAYFEEEVAVEKGRAVLLLSMFWVGLTLGRWLAGARLKHVNPYHVVMTSILVGGAGVVLMLLVTNPLAAGIGIFVAGFGFAAIFPFLLGLVGDLYPDISGTAFGVVFVIALVGGSTFPYMIGVLGDLVGLRAAFLVIPVSLTLTLFLLHSVKARLTRDE